MARSITPWQPKIGDQNWKDLTDAALAKFQNTEAGRSINLAGTLS